MTRPLLLLFALALLTRTALAGSISGWEEGRHPETVRAMDYPHATEPGSEFLGAAAALLVVAVWRRRRWDRGAASALVGALVALGVTEAVLQLDRLGNASSAAEFEPHPTLFWERAYTGESVNSDGLQNPEVPRDKAPGEFRILCLGDSSSTYRDGWDFSYPRQLAPMLPEVTVINGGVPGYSSYQGLLLLRSKLIRYHPDVVILAFGFHDGTLDLATDRAHFTDNAAVHWARALLYRSQVFLVLRHLTLGLSPDLPAPRRLVPRVSPEEYVENLEGFRALARAEGFRLAIVRMPLNEATASPLKSSTVADYGRLAESFGARSGVPVLDAMRGFPTSDFEPGNDNHLVASGAERLARRVADFLKREGLVSASPATPAE